MSEESLVTLSYNELLLLSNTDPTNEEQQQPQPPQLLLLERIGKAFGNGPESLGILAVTGVPHFDRLRQDLLPLAAQIPTLPDLQDCIDENSMYSVGWSHGKEMLEEGVADIAKGSYYANPLLDAVDPYQAIVQRRDSLQMGVSQDETETAITVPQYVLDNPCFFAPNIYPKSLPQLQIAIQAMGKCIHHVGVMIAGLCQAYVESQQQQQQQHATKENPQSLPLQQIIQDSLNCKARLLHYFHMQDTTDDTTTNKDNDKNKSNTKSPSKERWWCGWHNDHGALTGLVPAMYLDQQGNQIMTTPNPHSAGATTTTGAAGLYVKSRSGKMIHVKLPSNALAFQIGETFQLLSGGLLMATPHAVRAPPPPPPTTTTTTSSTATTTTRMTRESFAVFLEPEFDFPLTIPSTIQDCQKDESSLPKSVRPLRMRWKPGMTFGQFHNATVSAFHVSSTTENGGLSGG